jgi:hypothetical protein
MERPKVIDRHGFQIDLLHHTAALHFVFQSYEGVIQVAVGAVQASRNLRIWVVRHLNLHIRM